VKNASLLPCSATYGGNRTLLLRYKSGRYLSALESMLEGSYRNSILACDRASAGEIAAARERGGRPIEAMDAMIAATCLVHGATLATRNTRDFDGLALKLVNPFEQEV